MMYAHELVIWNYREILKYFPMYYISHIISEYFFPILLEHFHSTGRGNRASCSQTKYLCNKWRAVEWRPWHHQWVNTTPMRQSKRLTLFQFSTPRGKDIFPLRWIRDPVTTYNHGQVRCIPYCRVVEISNLWANFEQSALNDPKLISMPCKSWCKINRKLPRLHRR